MLILYWSSVCVCSWSWQDRYTDWLLLDETLRDVCCWNHCMDTHCSAGIDPWTSAAIHGTVRNCILLYTWLKTEQMSCQSSVHLSILVSRGLLEFFAPKVTKLLCRKAYNSLHDSAVVCNLSCPLNESDTFFKLWCFIFCRYFMLLEYLMTKMCTLLIAEKLFLSDKI